MFLINSFKANIVSYVDTDKKMKSNTDTDMDMDTDMNKNIIQKY
jgi:hypothetical protein